VFTQKLASVLTVAQSSAGGLLPKWHTHRGSIARLLASFLIHHLLTFCIILHLITCINT
jgi:hypothetical protein